MNSKDKAKDLINKFYYSLPNNGFINEGINSCESRWKEAVTCALIAVDEMLSNCYEVMKPFWQEVKEEIEKI